MTLNPYQELNLDPTALAADVKRAYRKLDELDYRRAVDRVWGIQRK